MEASDDSGQRFASAAATQQKQNPSSMPPATAQQHSQQGHQAEVRQKLEQHQQLAVTASSKLSPLRWLTSGSPTNQNMLLFRTLNRELQQPNTNLDDLAMLLRDKLMPLRVWWMRHGPGGPAQFRKALEHRRLGVPGVVNFVDARTQWIDQMVDSSLSHCNIHQVVCIAAGFDTRAYRFGRRHTDVQFYEVDLPSASRKKQQLVQRLFVPQCNYPRPVFIAADLSKEDLARVLLGSNDSTTAGSGFDPSLPTLFTLEGLIYYLPEAAVKRLFAALLSIAAPGSRLVFDFLHKKVLEGRVPLPPAYKVTALSVANKGEPFLSGIDDSPAAVARFMNSIPASDSAAPDTTGTSDQRAAGSCKGYKLLEYLEPKDIMAKQLPHLQWDDELPPILSFYSYAAFEVQSVTDW